MDIFWIDFKEMDDKPLSNSPFLNLAAAKGDICTVKNILDTEGCDLYNVTNDYYTTPLRLAELNGHKEVAFLFLTMITERNNRLVQAATDGREDEVSLLLSLGVDVGDGVVNSSLICAVQQGHTSIVKLLVENGVNVNHKTACGRTPLFEAASRGYLDITKYLVEKGAVINVWGCPKTPLEAASDNGHSNVARYLQSQGGVRVTENCLFQAVQDGRLEDVKFLLHMGVNVSAKNSSNWTPLHFAAEYGHLSIAKCMVAEGADVNSRGNWGQTPLFDAAFFGHMEVVKFLVDNGADVNVRGYGNLTPMCVAYENGYYFVAYYLQSKGGVWW